MKGFINKWLQKAYKSVDKLLHALITYAVVVSAALYDRVFLGILFAIVLSIGKEIFDQWMYNGWSWGDLLADTVGILLALFVCIGIL